MSNETKLLWAEVAHLKQRAEDRNTHYREIVGSTWDADQKQQQAIIDGIQKRLDALSNESTKEVDVLREKFEASLRAVEKQVGDQSKTNWPLLVSGLSVAGGAVLGCWVVMGLLIQSATAPQVTALAQLATSSVSTEARLRSLEGDTSASKSADVESKIDRNRLNTRVGDLESKLSTLDASRREAEARQAATNVEIETQFCAADSFRNLTHAADMRVISMVWSRTHPGETYPTDNAYYPIICNRTPR